MTERGTELNISERVLFLRESILKMTQNEFGEAIGIKGAAISRIERGISTLTKSRGMLICSKFGVRSDWLWYNKGEIFEKKAGAKVYAEKYERLDPKLKAFLDVILDSVLENQEKLLK